MTAVIFTGDETKSTVSDTWSTDVLAGDSEPPEQTQMERLEEVTEEGIGQNLLGVQEVRMVSVHSAGKVRKNVSSCMPLGGEKYGVIMCGGD